MSLNNLSSAQQPAVCTYAYTIKYVETYEFAEFTNIAHYENVNKNENITNILLIKITPCIRSFRNIECKIHKACQHMKLL